MVMNQARKMSQNDLWEKAAACVKAGHPSSDPKRRAILPAWAGFGSTLAQDIKWLQEKAPPGAGPPDGVTGAGELQSSQLGSWLMNRRISIRFRGGRNIRPQGCLRSLDRRTGPRRGRFIGRCHAELTNVNAGAERKPIPAV
jgi:hypothetical protein